MCVAAGGVTNIVNLQEDKDFAYWGVDFEAYRRRATELGMFLDRRPVRSRTPLQASLALLIMGSLQPKASVLCCLAARQRSFDGLSLALIPS